jgi:hypothetical protein
LFVPQGTTAVAATTRRINQQQTNVTATVPASANWANIARRAAQIDLTTPQISQHMTQEQLELRLQQHNISIKQMIQEQNSQNMAQLQQLIASMKQQEPAIPQQPIGAADDHQAWQQRFEQAMNTMWQQSQNQSQQIQQIIAALGPIMESVNKQQQHIDSVTQRARSKTRNAPSHNVQVQQPQSQLQQTQLPFVATAPFTSQQQPQQQMQQQPQQHSQQQLQQQSQQLQQPVSKPDLQNQMNDQLHSLTAAPMPSTSSSASDSLVNAAL